MKILEVVEFIEALESIDGMCAARELSAIKNDSSAILITGKAVSELVCL